MKTLVEKFAFISLFSIGAAFSGMPAASAVTLGFYSSLSPLEDPWLSYSLGNSLQSELIELAINLHNNPKGFQNSVSSAYSGVDLCNSLLDCLAQFETLPAGLRLGTPGNDNIVGELTNDIQIGRVGNDRLIPVNPGATTPGFGEIDILIGGPRSLEGATSGPDSDLFVLGDARNAYYAGGQESKGTLDFAVIVDFGIDLGTSNLGDPDFIQLNGSSLDYFLSAFRIDQLGQIGTGIFKRAAASADLLALVLGATDLNLNSSEFQYVSESPPDETKEGIQQLGSPGIDFSFDSARGAVDSENNFYFGGLTTDTLSGSSQGSQDAWIAKYDTKGNQQWVTQFGTPDADIVFGLALNSTGDVIAVGNTAGDLAGENQGDLDAYFARFNGNTGDLLQIVQYGGALIDTATDVAVSPNDNIFITGFSQNAIDTVDGSTPLGGDDPYLAKFNSSGNLEWLQQFGTAQFDEAYGVALDPFGNSYLTGFTVGDLSTFGETNQGLYDVFLAKVLADGQLSWIRQFGSPDYEFAWDVATDQDGNVYNIGWTLGDLDGGGNRGKYDGWVSKFDPFGNQLWLEQFGTTESDQAFGLKVGSDGLLYIAGYTTGVFGEQNFGGDVIGADDAFLAKFDLDGNLVAINQFGTSRPDRGFGVDIDKSGRLVINGFTEGSLGGINQGSYDAWIATGGAIHQPVTEQVPTPAMLPGLFAFGARVLSKKRRV